MLNSSHRENGDRTARRLAKVYLDTDYLADARELGIDISQACERGLAEAIAKERAKRWVFAHREAVESYFGYVGNYCPNFSKPGS